MNLNISGMAAAYQGYQDEQRRQLDMESRAKAEQRADQDARFQEDARTRQRKEWARSDKILADDDADRQELMRQYANPADNSKASSAPTLEAGGLPQALPAEVASVRKLDALMANGTPSGAAAGPANPPGAPVDAPATAGTPASTSNPALATPSGLPKPHNFNSTLDQQTDFLNRKMARGTLSAQDYATSMSMINRMKEEGIHDALALMSQGRYDDAMDKYNSTGQMRGASVIDGREGVTKINGQDVPTHLVTVQNADGSRTVMDVAQAQYKLLDINSRLGHIDKARQTNMMADHYAGTLALGREQLAQSAKDAAASRAIQSGHLALARQQLLATTPAGIIASKEQALGRPMTFDEKATMLGVDSMPPALKLQLTSLLKELDQNAQAINKAMEDPAWLASDKDGKANPLLVRQAVLRSQMGQLLQGQGAVGTTQGGNRLGLTPPGQPATQGIPAPAVPQSLPQGSLKAPATPSASNSAPVIKAPGGVAPPDHVMVENGVIDVRNDPVLQQLRKAAATLDPQNPAQSDQMMKLGSAINARIDQLQQNYGRLSRLIY